MKKLLLPVMVCFMALTSFANVKTNVNEVTDLFDKHIDNKNSLLLHLDNEGKRAVEGIKSKRPLSMIEGIDKAEGKAAELNSINPTDLDNAGRSARASKEYQFYDENELEPNYSKAGNKMHKLDAEDIAEATAKVIGDLLDKLKELGVDCKTVKGPIQKDPVYYIDVKREKQKNTEYDQFFCEELRNKYNCIDSLSLTCKRKGFVKTEKAKIYIPAGEVEHLFHEDQWGRSTFWEMHLVTGIIAAKLGASAENIVMEEKQIIRWAKRNGKFYNRFIGYTIDDNGQLGNGNHGDTYKGYNHFAEGFDSSYGFHKPTWCGNQSWHPGTVIRFWYSLAEEVCEEWSEDWTERCTLK